MLLGSLAIVVGLAAIAWFVAWRFRARIDADMVVVCAAPAALPAGGGLPPLLAALVARSRLPDAVADGAGMRWSRIEQTGEMRLKPDGPWQSFTATQVYAVGEPAFVWRADFALFRVVDSLVGGAGRLEARVLGVLPVVRAEGAETTRAQLLRYLAEIVWVPRAITGNRGITWRQVDDRTVLGLLRHGAFEVELRFRFDAAGDIVRVEGVRDYTVDGRAVPTPWVGAFSDYGTVGGVRVPRRGEVQWLLDDGAFAYWRGTVTAVAVDRSERG